MPTTTTITGIINDHWSLYLKGEWPSKRKWSHDETERGSNR